MSEGFIGRWSRRKLDAREGREHAAEPGSKDLEVAAPPRQPSPGGPLAGQGQGGGAALPQPENPPPTLEDVQALSADSDFSRFVTPEVAPEVKNAALKKLFADPRFNVMDGMDVYIDDYTKPDPIPETMLRKLAAARFLGLFEEKNEDKEKEAEKETQLDRDSASRDVADNSGVQSVAQSAEIPPAVPEPSVHDDPDLRLQQDDAPSGEEPGRGTQ